MKLGYKLDGDGYVTAAGYDVTFPYYINGDTPFDDINEAFYYQLKDGEWIWYDCDEGLETNEI